MTVELEDGAISRSTVFRVPRVALMVVTDGRWDYLEQTLASFEEMCEFPFAYKVIVNDVGDGSVYAAKASHGCHYDEVVNQTRRGLAGAIQSGWDAVPSDVEFVFHLEDDFTFPQPVDIPAMLHALHEYPDLAQVALKRQPWSPQEQLAGNMLDLKPGLEEVDGLCVHDSLFTFNPCLYPIEITRYGAGLEQELTDKLRADGWRFGYLGGKDDPPRCIHIGHRRSEGYRW